MVSPINNERVTDDAAQGRSREEAAKKDGLAVVNAMNRWASEIYRDRLREITTTHHSVNSMPNDIYQEYMRIKSLADEIEIMASRLRSDVLNGYGVTL